MYKNTGHFIMLENVRNIYAEVHNTRTSYNQPARFFFILASANIEEASLLKYKTIKIVHLYVN